MNLDLIDVVRLYNNLSSRIVWGFSKILYQFDKVKEIDV